MEQRPRPSVASYPRPTPRVDRDRSTSRVPRRLPVSSEADSPFGQGCLLERDHTSCAIDRRQDHALEGAASRRRHQCPDIHPLGQKPTGFAPAPRQYCGRPRGRIALRRIPMHPVYRHAPAGVVPLTGCMAAHSAPASIGVNELRPSAIPARITDMFVPDTRTLPQLRPKSDAHSLGLGTPDESVLDSVHLHLASPVACAARHYIWIVPPPHSERTSLLGPTDRQTWLNFGFDSSSGHARWSR